MIKNKFYLLIIFLMVSGTLFSQEEYKFTNALIDEKSPYLLQHSHNPVNWFPWGDRAFKKAVKEDKPIFLSIGYSTCHWCHVMEEESFTNLEIAQILNDNFIAIKVDREERPDIDGIYMKATQLMTGGGGWPLNLFITPDAKPFFAGTYFLPEDKWGKPGLKTILSSIAIAWNEDKQKIIESSDFMAKALRDSSDSFSQKGNDLDKKIFHKAYTGFKNSFDQDYGGFSVSPKFPTTHNLNFLLRYYQRFKQDHALEMVETTLINIAKGGVFDQIGGGFHRYSTDQRWFLPHFEKMLYDQALLTKVYLELYKITRNEKYALIARETLDFVLSRMRDGEGGFYSAYDADSFTDNEKNRKQEGAFYVWSKKDIKKILGKDSGIFCYAFGVKDKGNVGQDPFNEFKDKNVLYRAHSLDEISKKFNINQVKIKRIIKQSRIKLLDARSRRPNPHLDDKILTDWNGLMISSLSYAGALFSDRKYTKAAKEAAEFILNELIDEDEALLHRYRDGEAKISGFLLDYAFFVQGLLDLYQATFDPKYLKEAKELNAKTVEFFWDKEGGGFFDTSNTSEELLFRPKNFYDGAIPSANSIAVLNLIRLSRFTKDDNLKVLSEVFFKSLSSQLLQAPRAHTQSLVSFDYFLGPSYEIVVSGDKDSQDTKNFINFINNQFLPNKVLILRPSNTPHEIISLVPYIENQSPIEGRATIYICKDFTCKFPVTTIKEVKDILNIN